MKDDNSKSIDSQLEQLKIKKDTIKLINKIEGEKKFSANPSYFCEWCKYQPNCGQWPHQFKLDEKPVNEFLNDPGVKLINLYDELQQKKKTYVDEVDLELEKIKEAIIAFAHKEKIDVVFSSNNKAKISIIEKASYHGENEQKREVLNNIIKQEGKLDEVSELDTYVLNHKIKEKEFPPQLINQIQKFQTIEKTERVSFSKIINKEEYNHDSYHV